VTVADLPALNATLNMTAAILLAGGMLFIKKKKARAHQLCMMSAMTVSALFLVSYLVYHYHAGAVHFTRQGWIRYVYFPILLTHTTLAILILPMALRTVYLSLSKRFFEHVRIARWTFPVWMYVSVTGVVVYLMLYR